MRVLVKVADHMLPVVFLKLKPVEPKLVVLAVSEPRSSLFLARPNDNAFDGCRLGACPHGDLLGDADARAGLEGLLCFWHRAGV